MRPRNLTLRGVEIRRLHGAITNGGRLRLVGSASVKDNCKNTIVDYGVMVMNGVSRFSRTCPMSAGHPLGGCSSTPAA